MTFSSSLLDRYSTFVIDTSVIINLQACEIGNDILRTIANPFIVTQEVFDEIEENPNSSHQKTISFLDDIVDSKLLQIIALSREEKEMFHKRMNETPQLHDGEVATIMLAKNRIFTPIIDERLGRGIASEELSGRIVGTTMDILFHPKVLAHFNKRTFKLAIYKALRIRRLQIDKKDRDFVVELIGKKRAKNCTCLPGYQSLMRSWGEPRSSKN